MRREARFVKMDQEHEKQLRFLRQRWEMNISDALRRCLEIGFAQESRAVVMESLKGGEK